MNNIKILKPKIRQTKMLVTCQRFSDWFLFGLVWQYSSVYNKGRFKVMACSSNITLSLPSYTGSALKRELNFCNGYLSLLYFCAALLPEFQILSKSHGSFFYLNYDSMNAPIRGIFKMV